MDGDVIDGNADYALSASHVFMTEAEAATWLAPSPDYVARANARALLVGNASSTPTSNVPTAIKVAGEVSAAEGIYQVTFAVAQDITVRITVDFVVSSGPYYMLSYHSADHEAGSAPASSHYLRGGTATVQSSGTLARSGFTFAGWALDNPYASSYTEVTHLPGALVLMDGQMSLYAVWVQDADAPVVPPPARIEPPAITEVIKTIETTRMVFPPVGPTLYVPVPSETATQQSQESQLAPPAEIKSQKVPTNAVTDERHWSLVNLLCTLFLVLTLLMAVTYVLRRSNRASGEQVSGEPYIDEQDPASVRASDSYATRIFLCLSIFASAAELFLFAWTQDLALGMALFDEHTTQFIALLVFGLMSTIFLLTSRSTTDYSSFRAGQRRWDVDLDE
jgi:hypothetical protein